MRSLTVEEICFPDEEAPLIEDITLDGPCLTRQQYPLARDNLKCADCGALMGIRSSKKYPNPFYGCSKFPECRGTHGAYPDGRPLGRPANKATKLARMRAHAVFDLIWQEPKHDHTRSQAYAWMSMKLLLQKGCAHIALFDLKQCEQLIEAVKQDFPSVRTSWDRILDTPFDVDEETVFDTLMDVDIGC